MSVRSRSATPTLVLPERFRKGVQSNARKILQRACRRFHVDRGFIAYIENDDQFRVEARLWHGKENYPLLILDTNQGLCGWAAREDRIVIYPADEHSQAHFLTPGGLATVSEIVGPIHFEGDVTGVLLLHSGDDERKFDKPDRVAFQDVLAQLDGEIRRVKEEKSETAVQLRYLADRCFRETFVSARGYVAVKDWDGKFEYFKVGSKPERFLDLDFSEGLCGEVMSTGEPVNCGDVLAYPSYKPSDPKIKAEIVYPIKDGNETIGVINMESENQEAYQAHFQNVVERYAKDAVPLARIYRRPPAEDFGYILGDLVVSVAALLERSLYLRAETIEPTIIELLRTKAQSALSGERSACWQARDVPPFFTSEIEIEEGILRCGFEGDEQLRTVFAAVVLSGTSVAVVAIEKARADEGDRRILQVFCRVVASFLRHLRYEQQLRSYIGLSHDLTSGQPIAALVERVVQVIPNLFDGEHCTLLYRTEIDGQVLFFPGVSTSNKLFETATEGTDCDPWYEARREDGLTGWVAATGKPLRIKDIGDKRELLQIAPELTWRGRLKEERQARARSYLACPVFAPNGAESPENVIGVIRTYRKFDSRRSGFSEEDYLVLRTLAYLIATPLSVVVSRGLIERWRGNAIALQSGARS